ncbi:hypothetical protein [Aquabacterium sp. A7-Y]|uniref:hypothetical protein n=1 Tax=Aquabacterium sp. A7-Y TaxID=1349605 RepID=UPI0039FC6759
MPDGSGIAGAIEYSLNRWTVLDRFLADGEVSSGATILPVTTSTAPWNGWPRSRAPSKTSGLGRPACSGATWGRAL